MERDVKRGCCSCTSYKLTMKQEPCKSCKDWSNWEDIQTHQAVDAILAQTAITFGEVVKDEETGAKLGHRLTVPAFKVGGILGKYQVRTRRDEETGAYIIGVVPKEEETEADAE